MSDLDLSFVDTMTSDDQASVEQAAVTARLVVVHPPELVGAVAPVTLGDFGAVVGRTRLHGATVVLPHRTVSRRHAELRWHEGGHVLQDLGSHNGTSLDGRRLGKNASARLYDGAALAIGDVALVYEHAAVADGGGEVVDGLPGDALSMVALRSAVVRAAKDPSPALIIGETGTGKEYVARALHELSGRKGPFVALNCAALSPQLVEAQLFGHVRGAYTGATLAGEGLFRAADGGTLLLDEIGELPLELQPKLLRALQERRVRPVGSTREQAVDVRVVAATNRDLPARVEEGAFRRDLYARLALHELRVPAMRERRADILAWIQRLLARWATERDRRPPQLCFSPSAATAALTSPWPDNLRGVDRLVHRIAHLDRTITPEDIHAVAAPPGTAPPRPLGPTVGSHIAVAPGGSQAATGASGGRRTSSAAASTAPSAPTAAPSAPETVASRKRRPSPSRDELLDVLRSTGSVRGTAKHFDRDRRQIYRWIKSHDIDMSEFEGL